MKTFLRLLVAGALAAVLGFVLFYYVGTRHPSAVAASPTPELAWLRTEFHLSDADFTRVCQMHRDYAPQCEEMCRRIKEKNAELARLIAATNTVTPAIETNLAQSAELRRDCQLMMLRHFLEVSRAMPPAEGRRYLAEMQERTMVSAPAEH